MPKKTILPIALLAISVASTGLCIDPGALAALKQAGIGDKTIQALIEEKSLETQALRVPEIISLKQAGLDDDALVAVIRAGSFMRNHQTVEYRISPSTEGHWRAEEIQVLKSMGLSDAAIVALAKVESGHDQQQRLAWRMLERMGICVGTGEP